MWQRYELKDRAKITLKACYWKTVIVAFILMLAGGGSYTITYHQNQTNIIDETSHVQSFNHSSSLMLFGILFWGMLFYFVILSLINIFLYGPFEVGAKRYFILSKIQSSNLSELIFAFQKAYMNIVKIQFLRGLFTFLWSLLLFIPGIIKAYEYRMIPYILAENPHLDYREVFQLSRTMMDGEKWNTFVLDLSFLGWILLSSATCGILAIFYVNPYVHLTNAELYDVLKNK